MLTYRRLCTLWKTWGKANKGFALITSREHEANIPTVRKLMKATHKKNSTSYCTASEKCLTIGSWFQLRLMNICGITKTRK